MDQRRGSQPISGGASLSPCAPASVPACVWSNIENKAFPESKIKQKFIQILENLPNECGVYYIHNEQNEIIYIGRSKSIRKRINKHLTGKSSKSIKIQI